MHGQHQLFNLRPSTSSTPLYYSAIRMSDLVGFGVAMDRALLRDFDRLIAALGYENRSEALRDLVRADLTRAAWDGGAVVAATLTVVYRPQVRDVVTRLS